MNQSSDPLWPRASSWIAGESFDDPIGELYVYGAPLNRSISPGRCDLAPAAIREALLKLSTYDIERNVDVRQIKCVDEGDIGLLSNETAIEEVMAKVGDKGPFVLIGGDNGVTRPGVHSLQIPLDRAGLVTLDAHLDLRSTSGGLHNGNPVRALLEDGLPGSNIVQIGLAPFANSLEYANVAKDAGIQVVTVTEVCEKGVERVMTDALDRLSYRTDAIYFDLDMDVLDRSFAPACPGSRPGGLLPHEATVAARIAGAHKHVKAMDIVEIDPERDTNSVTTIAAAMCLASFAVGLVERWRV